MTGSNCNFYLCPCDLGKKSKWLLLHNGLEYSFSHRYICNVIIFVPKVQYQAVTHVSFKSLESAPSNALDLHTVYV